MPINLIEGVTTMDKKYITKMMSFLCMSDAALTMHKECINTSYHISQTKGKDGLICLSALLLDELRIGYKITEYQIKGSDTVYTRLSSRVHPFLTKLWNRIYMDGRKVLDPHAFKQLDWEAMSVLYMSDGNIQGHKGSPRHSAMINLCRLSYAELMWFRAQVFERLDLLGNVYKCGKYYRFGFRYDESDIFFEKIRPFMLEEYMYKLPNERPLLEGDDIV